MVLFNSELFFFGLPLVVVLALALNTFLPKSRPVRAARVAVRVLLSALVSGLCLAGFSAGKPYSCCVQ